MTPHSNHLDQTVLMMGLNISGTLLNNSTNVNISDQPCQSKISKKFKKKSSLRLHSNKYWRKKPQNKTLEVSGQITEDADTERSVG